MASEDTESITSTFSQPRINFDFLEDALEKIKVMTKKCVRSDEKTKVLDC
jgi:hypothetical protein